MNNTVSSLDVQSGGDHYKNLPIQPIEFNQRNKLNFCEGNIVKYTCRHHTKNQLGDVAKIVHYALLLAELEYDASVEDVMKLVMETQDD